MWHYPNSSLLAGVYTARFFIGSGHSSQSPWGGDEWPHNNQGERSSRLSNKVFLTETVYLLDILFRSAHKMSQKVLRSSLWSFLTPLPRLIPGRGNPMERLATGIGLGKTLLTTIGLRINFNVVNKKWRYDNCCKVFPSTPHHFCGYCPCCKPPLDSLGDAKGSGFHHRSSRCWVGLSGSLAERLA